MECLFCSSRAIDEDVKDHILATTVCKLLGISDPTFEDLINSSQICYNCTIKFNDEDSADSGHLSHVKDDLLNDLYTSQEISELRHEPMDIRTKIVQELRRINCDDEFELVTPKIEVVDEDFSEMDQIPEPDDSYLLHDQAIDNEDQSNGMNPKTKMNEKKRKAGKKTSKNEKSESKSNPKPVVEKKSNDDGDSDSDKPSSEKGDKTSRVIRTKSTKEILIKKSASKSKTATIRHVCDECGQDFRLPSLLRIHERKHTGELPYKCTFPNCGAAFRARDFLVRHLRLNPKSHKTVKDEATTTSNIVSVSGSQCPSLNSKEKKCPEPECGLTFKLPSSLKIHMRKHTGVLPYACDFSNCGLTFRSKSSLWKHSKNPKCHEESYLGRRKGRDLTGLVREKTCHQCNVTFKKPYLLDIHMRKHTGERPFLCTICGKGFSVKYYLDRHIKDLHKGAADENLCHVCSKGFNSSRKLSRHLKRHEKSGSNLIMRTRNNINSTNGPFVCDTEDCSKLFQTQNSLILHQRTHTGTGERPFVCEVCSSAFVSSEKLKSHCKLHGSEFGGIKCDYCDSYFPKNRVVLEHINAVHKGVKGYQCSICGQTFAHSQSLNRHKRVSHGVTALKCPKCPTYYETSEKLETHLQFRHSNQQIFQFQCTESTCKKGFLTKNLLESHLKHEHLKEKLYICDICPDKRYGKPSLLHKHKEKYNSLPLASTNGTIIDKSTSISKTIAETKTNVNEILVDGFPDQTFTDHFEDNFFDDNVPSPPNDELQFLNELDFEDDFTPVSQVEYSKINQKAIIHLEKIKLPEEHDPKKSYNIVTEPLISSFIRKEIKKKMKENVDQIKRNESLVITSSSNRICLECNLTFRKPYLLVIHQRTHTGENPFQCLFPGCDKSYRSHDYLNKHSKRIHKMNLAENKEKDMESSLVCHLCGWASKASRISLGNYLVKKHMRSKHGIGKKVGEEEEKFQCQTCGKVYTKKDSLARHAKAAHLPDELKKDLEKFSCSECNKEKFFYSASTLKHHQRTFHAQDFNYFCKDPECKKGFVKKSELERHFRQVHLKEKSYVCDQS